ncbi:hypothetical protein ACUNV4_18045 [Granulosicoccus sp. 3-233]|uniref:hypothetical protein n=1 Tax=Granulosicoccus sp. 3-233 TaxID=3417969 RepID=UPI003D324B08
MYKLTFRLCTGIALLAGSGSVVADDVFQVLVENQTMTWGANTFGYMQVQDATTWQTLCEYSVYTLQDTPSGNRDDTSCTVDPGIYNVINHTTRQRIHGITVGDLDGLYTAPRVDTIDGSWVQYDPYQITQADTIYSELNTVPSPAQLSAQVYSSTAVELFWDRSDVPGLHYDIYQADQLIDQTEGTSHFLSGLPSGEHLAFTVVARDASGRQSTASTIIVETPADPNTVIPPSTPSGLRAAVYSSNSLELFWDRQGPGQQFLVYDNNNDVLTRTDGTSYFASGLPLRNEHLFSVRAIDDADQLSDAASIIVSVDDPSSPSAITLDNADSVLKAVVEIANREPFEQASDRMSHGVGPVLQSAYNFFAETEQPANGLTLIEGTAGGISNEGFGGLNGGEYVCNAGGSANALSVFGGEISQGYRISLDKCVLPDGTYSGTVTSSSGGRSGYFGSQHENTAVTPVDDTLTYQYSGSYNGTYNRYQGIGTDTMTVILYSEESADGVRVMRITDFESVFNSQLKRENGSFLNILYGSIDATISFAAELPSVSTDTLSVFIELDYNPDSDVNEPVGLWHSGSLSVTASDGSSLLASLDDTDGDGTVESIVLTVGDDMINRPLDEGYLVSCRVESFEACSP